MEPLIVGFALAFAAPAPRTVSIGVDVGTGSARAGVVDVQTGALLAVAKRNIATWTPKPEYYQQSSEDIWAACSACVRGALADAGDVEVVGLGFDATCSLVCLDGHNQPVGTDPSAPDDDERNIILWMDHRATAQAAAINAQGHERLSTVGGTISPEMEIPKIRWLSEKMPEAFARVDSNGGKFLDLADFLAYRATDFAADVRSLCTVRARAHALTLHFRSICQPPSVHRAPVRGRWCASGITTPGQTAPVSGGTAASSQALASRRASCLHQSLVRRCGRRVSRSRAASGQLQLRISAWRQARRSPLA